METISRRQSFSEKGINVMSEKEKIIVFSSREICYQSSSFFANQMADAFEDLGFDVQVCEFDEHDDLDAVFQPLYGQKYRLLLDFNSTITRMVEEDGTPVLDKLDGPFFDYILDHPLFHYNCLNADLKNLNGIFLDEAQEAYVKRYYPRVKKTLTMPLGATEAVTGGKKTETDTVLFMGTYDRPDKIYEMVDLSPEPLRSYMKELIEMRIEDPILPMEEAFRQLLKTHGEDLPDDKFSLFMNAMYSVDAYIRDYFRKAALDELLKKKIPVQLVGEGWEKYQTPYERYRTIEKPVTFDLSFEKIAREQIMLDVSPIFNRGVHDRAIAGMANRTVVLTDSNPYRCAHFKNRKDMMFYSLAKIDSLSEAAGELMENEKLRSEIRENAYQTFCAGHTWRARAKEILSWEAED